MAKNNGDIAIGQQKYLSATVAADGTATVEFLPVLGDWEVTTVAVQSTSTLSSIAKNYRGVISGATFLDGTASGNGDMSDTVYVIKAGTKLIIQWTGATVGSTCTATITYNETVYGRGFRAQEM